MELKSILDSNYPKPGVSDSGVTLEYLNLLKSKYNKAIKDSLYGHGLSGGKVKRSRKGKGIDTILTNIPMYGDSGLRNSNKYKYDKGFRSLADIRNDRMVMHPNGGFIKLSDVWKSLKRIGAFVAPHAKSLANKLLSHGVDYAAEYAKKRLTGRALSGGMRKIPAQDIAKFISSRYGKKYFVNKKMSGAKLKMPKGFVKKFLENPILGFKSAGVKDFSTGNPSKRLIASYINGSALSGGSKKYKSAAKVKAGKESAKKSPWLKHVNRVRAKYPNLSYAEALKKASKSYK